MAIACFRLVTFLPLRPLLSLPDFFPSWRVRPFARRFLSTLHINGFYGPISIGMPRGRVLEDGPEMA
jgi:hypothetical protein